MIRPSFSKTDTNQFYHTMSLMMRSNSAKKIVRGMTPQKSSNFMRSGHIHTSVGNRTPMIHHEINKPQC
jgi:hypothetical protein